jgi:predicted permease
MQDRFSALPSVTAVGMATYSPLEGDNWSDCVIQQGHSAPRPGEKCEASWDHVSKDFLKAIDVPVLRGRGFTEQDTAKAPQVAIVNETFAKFFFPKQDPIGQHFGQTFPEYSGSFQIVGVFSDFKLSFPREEEHPVFLRPLAQRFTGYREASMNSGETQSMFINSMILSFRNPQADAEALIRRTLAGIDPNLTVMDLRTLDSQVAGNFDQDRLVSQLCSLFGVLSLILASVGLYGVMSYFVARRTSEIGIRMALGATRESVVTMIMRGALWQVLLGLSIGIPASIYAGYLMKSLLYGVASYDPWAIAGAPLMLLLCATVASFAPARRAATIEPMQALRTE